MPSLVMREKLNSRPGVEARGDGTKADLLYWLKQTDDELAVRVFVQANVPAFYLGLRIQDYTVDPIGNGYWDIAAHYSKIIPREPGSTVTNFETSGGTQLITQSLQTVSYAPPGKTAPDFKGAIGVTKDSIEGVTVTVPVFSFSVTQQVLSANVTEAYILSLFRTTGCMNAAPFKGFAAGELLFLGASGTQRDDDAWEITFKFAGSPNAASITVGDITDIVKRGWDYLWVRYKESTNAGVLTREPIAVYIEQVYRTGYFDTLGLGS